MPLLRLRTSPQYHGKFRYSAWQEPNSRTLQPLYNPLRQRKIRTMRCRKFVLVSTGCMLMVSVALSLGFPWIDAASHPALGILGGVAATVLVLALDLLMRRFAPETRKVWSSGLGISPVEVSTTI